MDVTIINSSYTLERLPDLLDAVAALEPQLKNRAEIFLILENDDELISGFNKAVSDKIANIIVCPDVGVTAARNLGIDESSGKIVIFLDDDAVPSANWLDEILEPYSDQEIMAVGGSITPQWMGSPRPKWFPSELDWLVGSFYEGHPKERAFVRNLIGANMSFRREVFDVAGNFSTDIGAIGKKRISGDDSEFCMRVRQAYGPNHILFIPGALVHHRVSAERQTLGYSFRRAYVEGASKAVISRMFKGKSTEQLDTEYNHLIYLGTKGIPGKLKQGKCGQFVVLTCCTGLVLLGYARGRFVKVKGAI